MVLCASSSLLDERLAMTTCAPELTSALATAKPIPELPPITTAFFSFNGIPHLHIFSSCRYQSQTREYLPHRVKIPIIIYKYGGKRLLHIFIWQR